LQAAFTTTSEHITKWGSRVNCVRGKAGISIAAGELCCRQTVDRRSASTVAPIMELTCLMWCHAWLELRWCFLLGHTRASPIPPPRTRPPRSPAPPALPATSGDRCRCDAAPPGPSCGGEWGGGTRAAGTHVPT
jgi:hypothetical protein